MLTVALKVRSPLTRPHNSMCMRPQQQPWRTAGSVPNYPTYERPSAAADDGQIKHRRSVHMMYYSAVNCNNAISPRVLYTAGV